jgi:ribosomal protein S18 acetylase RimI-like enzyme
LGGVVVLSTSCSSKGLTNLQQFERAMNHPIDRLQAYLRQSAITQYRAIPVPPFTVFIQANDALTFFNYAIPDEPIAADSAEAQESLELLKSVFIRENRTPRFEFIGEYAPELSGLLEKVGFTEESRLPLMLCTAETLVMPSPIEGFSVVHLQADSAPEVAIAHSRIAHYGFMGDSDWLAEYEVGIPEQKADAVAKGMGLFVGYLDEEAVAVATYGVPYDGIIELAGVATLPAYRRRGLAGYLSAVATAHAFENGVTLALLSAGDEGASRVYERIGYRAGATAVAYSAKPEGGSA